MQRLRRMCELLEYRHCKVMHFKSGEAGARQLFATPDVVLERMDAMELEGGLAGRDGRPRLRYLTLFSGIEAATAAFERIGSDAVPVAFCEIDPAANAVLRFRWPDVPRVGDVTLSSDIRNPSRDDTENPSTSATVMPRLAPVRVSP